jgi:hypothetical protein
MSGDRTIVHAPHLQAGKAASKALVRAAGGQEAAEAMTGRRQSCFSDYGSPHTPAFMPVNLVHALEAVTHGTPNHPQVTRWLASEAGYLLVPRPNAGDGRNWGRSLQALGREFGEASGRVCQALGDADTPGRVTAAEIRDLKLIEQLDALAENVACMRAMATEAIEREGL